MHKMKILAVIAATLLLGTASANAAVATSQTVMQIQQTNYNKHQILTMLDSAEVKDKLMALGVSQADAAMRIENMTSAEINSLNEQLFEAPAGGIVGTIVTVLVVIAVLDVLGVTDVYPFINPI